MAEERQRSSLLVQRQPYSKDIMALWGVVTTAVNAYVAQVDRTIHGDVLPMTLRLMADEHVRCQARLEQAGLVTSPDADDAHAE